jgi:uridylate kinase
MPAVASRILLKLSGEALSGAQPYGIERAAIGAAAAEIGAVVAMGVQVGIMIGGGNIFRGVSPAAEGMDRATADCMGMLATVMNALALHDALDRRGIATRVMSALHVDGIVEPFVRPRALSHLRKGRVVVFAGGIGNPYFTTDTAACVRAIDIGAQLVLKSTKVDGVYTADPLKDPSARRYARIDYDTVLAEKLAVMDATAIVLCREHALPLVVFDMNRAGALARVVGGAPEGTYVGPDVYAAEGSA